MANEFTKVMKVVPFNVPGTVTVEPLNHKGDSFSVSLHHLTDSQLKYLAQEVLDDIWVTANRSSSNDKPILMMQTKGPVPDIEERRRKLLEDL